MRCILYFSALALVVSCVPKAEVSDSKVRAPANTTDVIPFVWGDKSFPKTIQLSNDFVASETANIQAMGVAWKTAMSNQKTFFTLGSTVSNISLTADPDSLYDSILGVYRTTNWPNEISSDALAVTQIFGRRYNAGSSSEFVVIEHADILVNFDDYNFDTNDDTVDEGYDLQTVMLHEMGHFLGLKHISEFASRTSSVMYPSITSSEVKRIPQSRDINELGNRYSIATAGSAMTVSSNQAMVPNSGDSGEHVRVTIELRSNGTCLHKMNGAEYQRHVVKLK